MMSIALSNRRVNCLAAFTFTALIFSVGLARPAAAKTDLLKEVAISSDHAARLERQPLTLKYGQKKWAPPPAILKNWYKTYSKNGQTFLQLRPGAIYDYLNIHVSPQLNDLGTQSRFAYIDGNLHLISSGRKGQIVDGVKTSQAIRAFLVNGTSIVNVSMKEYRPSIFSAEDFKKLSFPDQLARGESSFAGSPRNRIHNIQVATNRYNGLVLMPGEAFSFNQYLGSVDAQNGYLPELVIKENVTTPEYGGGICQVSTTAFRAAMQAGLKITNRRNHSYPVAYYGAPGYDATVYAPYTDLKFTNDTGYPVYITTKIIGSRVIFDVSGKTDGRQVTVNGPFVTSRKGDGSVTADVAQIVKKNGQNIREQNFVSHYQSPEKFPTIRAANGE